MLKNNVLPPLFVVLLIIAACETPLDASLENDTHASSSTMGAGKNASPAFSSPDATRWGDLSDADFWDYILNSDSMVVVGLKTPGRSKGVDEGRILVRGQEKSNLVEQVNSLPGVRIISADSLLPAVVAKVVNTSAVRALRNSPFVEYVEPFYFVDIEKDRFWQDEGWSGCSQTPVPYPPTGPGDHDPWTFDRHSIEEGWIRSNGSGVTIGVVDTGIGVGNLQLNSEFTAGMSSGRSITKDWTQASSHSLKWNDDCGHGTKIAGILAAPRDGQSMVGVAWKSNLFAVRVDDDVSAFNNEIAIVLGIRKAAAASKIINMSFGTRFHYDLIEDEIEYWHNYYDRLFVGAAGTSPTPSYGVVFPARISEVVAVTGYDHSGKSRSAACRAASRFPLGSQRSRYGGRR